MDLARLGVGNESRVLDLGCGRGRHTFEALVRGAAVVPADLDAAALEEVAATASAMAAAGEAGRGASCDIVRADARHLPFAAESFDAVVASEVLEHIEDDGVAVAEIARVLRPGGRVAVTVPRFWPEAVCWGLSARYHDAAGGHVRIYRAGGLRDLLAQGGLEPYAASHAHALHSPYWWIKCAFDPPGHESLPARLYHRFLVWDIQRRPRLTRWLEAALDPVLGKSLVIYARRTGASSEMSPAA